VSPVRTSTKAGVSVPVIEKSGDADWTLPNETACIALLKELRWKNGPFCPYCGHLRIYNLNTTRLPFCGACKNTFSVKVGTIFHGSPLPIAKWFTAIRLVTDPENTVTAARIAEVLQVGNSTAWAILRRLRYASATPSFNRRIHARAGARVAPSAPELGAQNETPRRTYVTKFSIAMPFEEALVRFAGVERRELQESLTRPTRKRRSRVPKAETDSGRQR
jgi:transposase-like protein